MQTHCTGRRTGRDLTERAAAQGIISADERQRIDATTRAQDAVIQVDAYAPAAYAALKG